VTTHKKRFYVLRISFSKSAKGWGHENIVHDLLGIMFSDVFKIYQADKKSVHGSGAGF